MTIQYANTNQARKTQTIFRPLAFILSRRSRAVFLPARLITMRLSDPYRGVARGLIFCRRHVLYSRSPKLVVRLPCPKHLFFILLFDMAGLPFLLVRISTLVSSRHGRLLNEYFEFHTTHRLTMQAACRSPPMRRRITISRRHLSHNRHLNRELCWDNVGSARVCITPQCRLYKKGGDFYNNDGAFKTMGSRYVSARALRAKTRQ